MLIVVGRLFFLQVFDFQHFDSLSENNRISIKPLPPKRGLIFDRNGVLLAENIPSFTLELTPENIPDLNKTLVRLKDIFSFNDEKLKEIHKTLRKHRKFENIPVLFKLSPEQIARFSVQQHLFPGVQISPILIRSYPQKEQMAHVLGYVGRLSSEDLMRVDASNYKGTYYIGKSGLEKTFETLLHGTVGIEKSETNVAGRPVRLLEKIRATPGKNLYTTIDMDVQQVAREALGDQSGAVVAIQPDTGAVIAMVSQPSYDPNQFVIGIDEKSYSALSQSKKKPLVNRAVSGQYPPGSTLKPLIGLAGLEQKKITPTSSVYCPGWYQLEGHEHKYRDWKRWGHGQTNLRKAIVESCDVFFYDLAVSMGVDSFSTYLQQFGLGHRTGIELTGEAAGNMPTRAWKKAVYRQPWYPGETVIAGIGQGFMLTTPLQLAMSTAALASRGKVMQPTLVYATEDPLKRILDLEQPKTIRHINLKNNRNWDVIFHAMRQVISSPYGTAHNVTRFARHRMAGKTGTAQVFSLGEEEEYNAKDLKRSLRDHALFVGFSPPKKPRIAIAVLVEHAAHGGGSIAAPIAQKVIDSYLDKYEEQSTP
ncbi:MAG: penicillin-binding protein 2 [Gammaproteobacteria bacterium]|nr:MAG: penicillin-binding protein 2 [Gammaproteobacteria bacterium]